MAIKSPLDLLASNFKTSQSLGNWLFPVKNLVELDEESGFDYLRGNKTSARLWLRVMSWQQKERGKKEKRKKLKKSILSYNIGYESMGKRPTLSPSQPVSGQSSAHGKDGGGAYQRNATKGRLQSFGDIQMCDGWAIRDWTLLDFIMFLAAPVLRQMQPGLAFNCHSFLLHVKYRCMIVMGGNMETKGAFLREDGARKTKVQFDWLWGSGYWNQRGNVQEGLKGPLHSEILEVF